MSNEANYEIERRFLIRMPDVQRLSAMGESSSITQTYLKSEKGTTARVRRRGIPGDWTYTHTVKKRLSHIRREESEREISREEYERLLENADERKRSIVKTRHCIRYTGDRTGGGGPAHHPAGLALRHKGGHRGRALHQCGHGGKDPL